MTNDGWGSKWPSDLLSMRNADDKSNKDVYKYKPVLTDKDNNQKWLTHTSDKADYDNAVSLHKQGSNLVDDQQYLYFQCDGCREILDPHTKSFAKLQEHRVNAGWACKWNIDGIWGYKVYCSKCGEKAR